MVVNQFNYTTGSATLPDVGVLSYNGCIFSPLYETKVSGKVVQDAANRTTRYMEYTLSVDGYVTLPISATPSDNINPTMTNLRNLLTAQGGALIYEGRGFDLVVNAVAPATGILSLGGRDVAWGPVPTLIEFQPLGGGRSAKVQWQVVARIVEVKKAGKGLLQLNYETSVTYGEDGYSTLSVSGTIEVPLTRITQNDRSVPYTVDIYRRLLDERIFKGIDLKRFRMTNRVFNISRDKRTMEWNVTAEEMAYMDMPVDCSIARGTYSVRPTKVGPALATWVCTLRATYTVRLGASRKTAWTWFLALMRLRMSASQLGDIPSIPDAQAPKKPGIFVNPFGSVQTAPLGKSPFLSAGETVLDVLKAQGLKITSPKARNIWLIDFSVEEGVYLDSKTVSFSATWRLITKFSHILLASGLWTKLPEVDGNKNNLWAASMKAFSGSQSWLPNDLDPKLDVVVDFGGPNAI